jgi:diguanylate cyclase (GGDEF)-like protein/PAS domain S-box-containing protein
MATGEDIFTMADPTARQPELHGALETQLGMTHGSVHVKPSLATELGWVLWRMERACALGDPSMLGPASDAPAQLVRLAGRFWRDGMAGFTELNVLAHRAGALFETDLPRLIDAIAAIRGGVVSGLASERPDERICLAKRLDRLTHDPTAHAAYIQLLSGVGAWMASGLSERGHRLVDLECRRLRGELAQGWPLELVISPDALSCIGLESLAMAALAGGQLIISPGYYARTSQIIDLGDIVSLGYGVAGLAKHPAVANRAHHVFLKARLLADPIRVRILTALLDQPMSVIALASLCGVSKVEVRRHLRVLNRAGLIAPSHTQRPVRYMARPDGVDALLNDISAKLHRGHGRASGHHAASVARSADFEAIFTEAPIAIIQFDPAGHCLSANRAGCELFAASETDLTQLRMTHLLADNADLDAFAFDDTSSRGTRRREARLRRRDHTVFWASITVAPVASATGNVQFAYAMIESIAHRQGGADAVTALPNRGLFMDRLQRVISMDRRKRNGVAVLMIDLDGFKQINDTLGHRAGDEVLKEVADRLMSTMRAADIVARIGGDEFAVLLASCPSPSDATAIAAKIQAAIKRPFSVDGQPVNLDASVGWAARDDAFTDATAFLAEADAAMYVVKRRRAKYALSRPPHGGKVLDAVL